MQRNRTHFLTAAFVAFLGTSPALAQPAATATDTPAAPAFEAQPVSDASLGKVAGKQGGDQLADARNSAVVTENSVGDNVATGEVRISDNAFQNMSGLSMINVNTGNNVAMNAAMNVNISITPQQ